MTIAFQNIIYRSRRRIRLLFSAALGGAAFAPAFYAVTSTDARGADPTVLTALVVGDDANIVELALSCDLADGAGYLITAKAGTPAADMSVLLADTILPLKTPGAKRSATISATTGSALDDLYGVDLDFDGTDFSEGPDGDLAVVSGAANVQSALTRRALSGGLAWRADYGAGTRNFVDGPSPSLPALRASLVRQMQADDRVKRATATIVPGFDTTDEARVNVDAQLIGNVAIATAVKVKTA